MDDGDGGEFVTVVGRNETAASMSSSYVADQDIYKGRIYRFRCRVKNHIGWSGWSSPETQIAAAVFPGKPDAPSLLSAT
jgi:hypothetical protein